MSTSVITTQGFVLSVEPDFTKIADASGDNAVIWAKECQYFLQTIDRNKDLTRLVQSETGRASLRNAIINVAAVGLTLQPAAKLAYIVVRNGVAVLDISYRGLLKIAVDSHSILTAKAEIVRANDHYVPHGPFELPEHIFNPFASEAERGPIIGVYVAAKLCSGGVQIETLSMDAITKIRNVSQAQNGPWKTWPEEMMKKSAIKRASKGWPPTGRLAHAEAVLNEHEGLIDTDFQNDDAPAGRAKPARQNAAAIAQVALAAPEAGADSEDKAVFLQALEANVRARGTAFYEEAYRGMSKQQRQWLGKDGHEAMWALACDIDTQLPA